MLVNKQTNPLHGKLGRYWTEPVVAPLYWPGSIWKPIARASAAAAGQTNKRSFTDWLILLVACKRDAVAVSRRYSSKGGRMYQSTHLPRWQVPDRKLERFKFDTSGGKIYHYCVPQIEINCKRLRRWFWSRSTAESRTRCSLTAIAWSVC